MKTTFKFAALLMMFAALSCSKEPVESGIKPGTDPNEPAVRTFTASIDSPASVKAGISDDNVCTFTAGDFILVFNCKLYSGSGNDARVSLSNLNTINASPWVWPTEGNHLLKSTVSGQEDVSVAELIRVTDGMLSNGGKNITFNVTLSEPPAGHNYHFVVLSRMTEFNNFNSRTDNNRNYYVLNIFRYQATVPASARFIYCYGEAAADATTVKFYHHDSQLKYKCTGDYDKVTFEANGEQSDTNSINVDQTIYVKRVMNYASKPWTYSYGNIDGMYGKKYNSGTGGIITQTVVPNSTQTYYLAVAANLNLANGITIKLYKSGGLKKTITTSGAFTTAPGEIIDLGDLSKVAKATSYYEMWNAGKAIKIGDVSFDPADYSGIKVYHITEDKNVPESINSTGGIYFVDEGVTLTLDMNMYPNATGSAAKAFIVLCDKVGGGRAKFRVNGKTLGFKGNFSVAFKNMEITSTSTNGFIQSSNDGDASMNNNLIFDGCKIDMSAHTSGSFYFANFNGGYGFRDVILSGSDIVYPAVESRQFFIYGKTNGNVLGDLTVKNNLCYIKGGSATDEIVNQIDDRALIHDLWTGTLQFTNITMENNSFVNCFGKARVVSGNAQLVAQGGSLVVKNNLYYLNGEPQAYLKLVDLSEEKKTGVNITASENYSYVTAHPEKVQSWGNVACTQITTNPISSADWSAGTFVFNSSLPSGVGCSR